MRGNEFLDKLELIDAAYIEAADALPVHKKRSTKAWLVYAACILLAFCLTFTIAVPAMTASSPAFYNMLYTISPVTAQHFKPVQLSCEDNGIRMELVSAHIHDNTAEIYISMQDLEQTRFDETVDLFDSYRINTPFDSAGYCELSDFDPDTQTATFFIAIEHMGGQDITGDKLTFSVSEFLSHKKSFEGVIRDVQPGSVELTTATQTVYPRGISRSYSFDEYPDSFAYDNVKVLKPSDSIASPVDGVALTGIGYVDGYLHIQAYYENILETDNHGYIYLLNRKTGEMVCCNASVSFFDDSASGSYDDYIFSGISEDELDDYELYGDFTTSSGSVKGNWSVTFPLDNTGNK